jgi:hypothetical protein
LLTSGFHSNTRGERLFQYEHCNDGSGTHRKRVRLRTDAQEPHEAREVHEHAQDEEVPDSRNPRGSRDYRRNGAQPHERGCKHLVQVAHLAADFCPSPCALSLLAGTQFKNYFLVKKTSLYPSGSRSINSRLPHGQSLGSLEGFRPFALTSS